MNTNETLPPCPFCLADQHSACCCLVAAWKHSNERSEKLEAEVARLRSGFQGSCYCCEPVGELNQKLEAEVARLRDILIRATTEIEKVPFHTPKLTAFTAHRIAERYREEMANN
jgi:hypothetical protein